MEAAGRLSKAGFDVSILEKEDVSGGHLNDWYKLFPTDVIVTRSRNISMILFQIKR